MEAATESPHAGTFPSILAGLQAGMVGVWWMLAWLGVSAKLQLRSFWTSENLMASAFYGEGAIRTGFAARTLSGLALYLLLYSLLGALFAWAIRDRLPRFRVVLLSVLFAVAWYFVSYRLLWKSVMPLVALLHATRPTVLGHLVYGTFLGRYPLYLRRKKAAPAEAPAEVEAAVLEPVKAREGDGSDFPIQSPPSA